jgi:hypothetical protein
MNIPRELKKVIYRVNEMREKVKALSIASMRLSTPGSVQDFSDVDYSIVMFDEIVEERGDIAIDMDYNEIIVKEKGLYSVEIGFCAGFNGQEELNLIALVNDIPYSSTPTAIQGRTNNKPVSLFWKSTVRLNENDRIQLGAKNGDAGSVTVHVNRLHFEVRRILE